MHYTYQEIKSQYEALRKTFAYVTARKEELLAFYRRLSPDKLVYAACGSSYYLSQSAALSAWARLGLPSASLAAGDLMLHHQAYRKLLTGALLIASTRSGSTSEVLLAMEKVRTVAPTPVLAITCVENGEVAAAADLTLALPWAFDESVCQTRSVTNLYAANLLVIAILSNDEELLAGIERAIERGPAFMARYEEALAGIARDEWHDVAVLADGELQGIAREGALAFSEIARVPGGCYHLLDVRHGPIVLIGPKTLVLAALTGDGAEYEQALIADLIRRGAKVVTYRDRSLPASPGVRLEAEFGSHLDPAARGIPFIFLAQILAYHKAVAKGVDPDQPEGLDPWIKL